ncbi:F-type H+-transporting ATPase subunit a [Lachnospiraceae bacterium NE2001]|nr:F-type H+-transporting ATPase subunit a [Lachnospiraceae bacterium NE2001]
MSKKKRNGTIIVSALVLVMLIIGVVMNGVGEKHETIQEAMKDAVLHGDNKINLFGLAVNPSLLSAYIVTAILLVFALIIRIFFVPKFKMVPGKFQLLIEEWVGVFHGLAKTNSPHRNKALGAYIFGAGSYIFVGTMFELFGFQAVTTEGHSISLPAPLADINGAICMGVLSYLFILSGGIAGNKFKGVLLTLKEFSLPISMSFRLFGALLSGMLVTELVYYFITLSFVLPVIVGILFTLIHAIVQAYVLTMLTSIFYGEVSEVHHKEKKEKKEKKVKQVAEA